MLTCLHRMQLLRQETWVLLIWALQMYSYRNLWKVGLYLHLNIKVGRSQSCDILVSPMIDFVCYNDTVT